MLGTPAARQQEASPDATLSVFAPAAGRLMAARMEKTHNAAGHVRLVRRARGGKWYVGAAQSANLTGQTNDTIYHYRIVATNASGTYGEVRCSGPRSPRRQRAPAKEGKRKARRERAGIPGPLRVPPLDLRAGRVKGRRAADGQMTVRSRMIRP